LLIVARFLAAARTLHETLSHDIKRLHYDSFELNIINEIINTFEELSVNSLISISRFKTFNTVLTSNSSCSFFSDVMLGRCGPEWPRVVDRH